MVEITQTFLGKLVTATRAELAITQKTIQAARTDEVRTLKLLSSLDADISNLISKLNTQFSFASLRPVKLLIDKLASEMKQQNLPKQELAEEKTLEELASILRAKAAEIRSREKAIPKEQNQALETLLGLLAAIKAAEAIIKRTVTPLAILHNPKLYRLFEKDLANILAKYQAAIKSHSSGVAKNMLVEALSQLQNLTRNVEAEIRKGPAS